VFVRLLSGVSGILSGIESRRWDMALEVVMLPSSREPILSIVGMRRTRPFITSSVSSGGYGLPNSSYPSVGARCEGGLKNRSLVGDGSGDMARDTPSSVSLVICETSEWNLSCPTVPNWLCVSYSPSAKWSSSEYPDDVPGLDDEFLDVGVDWRVDSDVLCWNWWRGGMTTDEVDSPVM
jgi:hypothetical protein